MVANGFGRCQSVGFVLEFASFIAPTIPGELMRFWSGPRVFHTCGKNCGKSQVFEIGTDFGPICRGFRTGETVKHQQKQGFASPCFAETRWKYLFPGGEALPKTVSLNK